MECEHFEVNTFCSKNLQGRENFKDLGVDGRMILKCRDSDSMYCVHLVQLKCQLFVVVSTILVTGFQYKSRNCSNSWLAVGSSQRTLFHGVRKE